MTGRSRIDSLGLGEKIMAYWSSGLTYDEICRKISFEHRDSRISKSQISRYISRAGEIVAAAEDRKESRQIELTARSAKDMLAGFVGEIDDCRLKCENDLRMWLGLSRLKLEALDKVLKVTGAYTLDDSARVSSIGSMNSRQPVLGDSRCPDCAYGLIFKDGLDVRVIEQDPSRCEGCPYRGKFTRDELREILEDRSHLSSELFQKILAESKNGRYGLAETGERAA